MCWRRYDYDLSPSVLLCKRRRVWDVCPATTTATSTHLLTLLMDRKGSRCGHTTARPSSMPAVQKSKVSLMRLPCPPSVIRRLFLDRHCSGRGDRPKHHYSPSTRHLPADPKDHCSFARSLSLPRKTQKGGGEKDRRCHSLN